MAKVMIFIDGTWLYANTGKLAADYGRPDLQIDYGLLPEAVSRRVGDQLGFTEIDIVRTHLFASSPVNHDPQDSETVRRRLDFFNMLKEEHHYEVQVYPIDFRGRRVRSLDRDPDDHFEPREKCVDIALATSLIYYAAIPQAYDVAITIIGDRDYIPALQHTRHLAKRTAIASIRGSCASEYADPLDHARVKDLDIIWLNDMIRDIELKYERRQLVCQSEFHVGDRRVWTTYRPRKGQPFYCDECRKVFVERSSALQRGPTAIVAEQSAPVSPGLTGEHQVGTVYEVKDDRRYGFIRSESGHEYFFHISNLNGLGWEEIGIGIDVWFQIEAEPSPERAGKASNIRPFQD